MADLRCSYCGRGQGEDHSRRCGVVRQDFPEAYVEYPDEIKAERDKLRAQVEVLRGIVDDWAMHDSVRCEHLPWEGDCYCALARELRKAQELGVELDYSKLAPPAKVG